MLYNIYKTKRKSLLLLLIPLILSAYTHLWNPVGFPDVFFDEGVYMRRAMNVLDTGNPQEAFFYDHPFFGQIILAGALQLVGYPDSLNLSTDPTSLEKLYMVPRLFMGFLAILDTFLIYKITEKKFGQRTAIIASILFAVMPMSWLFRRILLDSIFLPFALSSILLAIYSQESNKKNLLIILSGVCLGLAVFTKIPAITLIPLILFLIYSINKKIRHIGLWFIPLILIPIIWPAYSLSVGQFDLWINDVLWQAGRSSVGLPVIIAYLFDIDPILMSLGISGFIFASIRRERFVILWFAPILVFFATIGFLQYFHWIPLIPVMCIATSILINKGIEKITKNNIKNYAILGVVLTISAFGLIFTSMLINSDISSSQFEALSFVLQNLNENDVAILASPVYSWILYDVYDRENALRDYFVILFEPIRTEKILFMSDPHFVYNIDWGPELKQLFENTKTIEKFEGNVGNIDVSKFPNGSYRFTRGGEIIEIRVTDDSSWTHKLTDLK